MRALARRTKAYVLKDAQGERFAEIALELPADPPSPGPGSIGYRVDRWNAQGVEQALAFIGHTPKGISIALYGPADSWQSSLEQLDQLLAAMPVQVMRGDGIRDSQLAEIELLVDAVRLLEQSDETRLADLVSDVDAGSAARKVQALLQREAERFAALADALPPPPIAGPGVRHARTEP